MRSSDDDDVTIVAAGITLHEALAAADELAGEDIAVRVIDLYSLKPVDAETLEAAAEETGAIVTVEDHWAEGGIGDTVLGALADSEQAPARQEARRDARCPAPARPTELLPRRRSTRPRSSRLSVRCASR